MVADVIALAPALYLLMVATPIITTDLKVKRIPNAYVAPAYIITLVALITASAVSGRWLAFWFSLGLFIVSFILLITISRTGMLGMGDVKLIGVMLWGMSWFTLWNGLLLLVAPMVLAFLIAGFIILVGKKHLLYDLRIPFAPFIYLSYALALALTLIY